MLVEHVVTNHFSKVEADGSISKLASLEDVSSLYVYTFTLLRKKYEENCNEKIRESHYGNTLQNGQSSYFMSSGMGRTTLSGKALEDQVSENIYCYNMRWQ